LIRPLGETEDLQYFLEFVAFQLRRRVDFELVEAYLNLFLTVCVAGGGLWVFFLPCWIWQVHMDAVLKTPALKAILTDIVTEQVCDGFVLRSM
jgi:hypothetical protein